MNRPSPIRFALQRAVLAAALIAGCCSAGVLAAAPASAAPTDPQTSAIDQAQASGEPVPVPSDTTEYSTTEAEPDGSLRATYSVQPQQVNVDGAWRPIDTTLRRDNGGTVAPGQTATALTLSNGGTGPLVTMTSGAGSLAISWPTKLPQPSLDRDTATYADVLPDIDLQVTANPDGGISEVLVVKTAAAAQNPALDALKLAVTTNNLALRHDSAGNISATDDAGAQVFRAPTPLMWDSGNDPNQDSGTGSDPSDLSAAPPVDAQVAALGVTTSASAITLTPDQALLSSPDTNYPIYIDPNWTSKPQDETGWDWVQEAFPNTSWWETTSNGNPAVGYQGWQAGSQGRNRTYYQFDVGNLWNATVSSATMYAEEYDTGYFDCTKSENIEVTATGAISPSTTWNNQPGYGTHQNTVAVLGASNANGCPNRKVSWDVTNSLQTTPDHIVTYRVQAPNVNGDESDKDYYRRFGGSDTTLSVNYNYTPNVPTGMSITPTLTSPSTACTGAPSTSGWLGNVPNFTLSSHISDPDKGAQLVGAQYHVWDRGTDGSTSTDVINFGDGYHSGSISGTGGPAPSAPIPTSKLRDGHNYGWDAVTADNSGYSNHISGTSDHCYFWYDATNPGTVSKGPISANPEVNHESTVTVSATDITPPGGNASGVNRFVWSGGSQSDLDGGGGNAATTSTSGLTGTATIHFTPTVWGTNYLYVAALDKAGNESAVAMLSYYASDDVTAQTHPGDVDDDGIPDLLAATKTTSSGGGSLVLFSSDGKNAAAPKLGANAIDAPDGTSWANTLIAHRSGPIISSSGNRIDDLWAWKTINGTGRLFYYVNNRNNPGFVVGTSPWYSATGKYGIDRPTTCGSCPPDLPYDSHNWNNVVQLIAPGDIDGDKYPDLLTVEVDPLVPNDPGHLYFFSGSTVSGKVLSPQVISAAAPTGTGDAAWSSFRVLAPGEDTQGSPDVNGCAAARTCTPPDLWVSDNASGNLFEYQVNCSDGTVSLGTPVAGPLTSYGPSSRPLMVSPGDINGDGYPDLYSITNTSELWANQGTRASGNFSLTGHTLVDVNHSYDWTSVTNLA